MTLCIHIPAPYLINLLKVFTPTFYTCTSLELEGGDPFSFYA